MLSSCCMKLIIRVISFNCSSQQSRLRAPACCHLRKWESLFWCSTGSDYFSVLWESSDKHIFVVCGDWYLYVWFLLNETVKTQPQPHPLANPRFLCFPVVVLSPLATASDLWASLSRHTVPPAGTCRGKWPCPLAPALACTEDYLVLERRRG